MNEFTCKAYLRTDCPYSFKFLLFMAEAGLLAHIELIHVDPNAADFERTKQKLAAGLGGKATFPAVQVAPDRYMADSDALIAHFAERHGVDADALVALGFYKRGILPQLQKLH